MYMFRDKFLVISLLMITGCFSSCFEVIEEINMKKDGSGMMTLTVNFSQSKTKLAAIMLLDTINGRKVPDKQEIQQEIAKTITQLEKMPGVSNVKNTLDFTNFIATVNFSFKDISDVNRLSKSLLQQYKAPDVDIPTYSYNKEDARFSSNYSYSGDVRAQFNKLSNRDKEIFKSATYTSIFRFESPITSYNNKLANVSRNQLATMQRCAILDVINGKINISNQVQLSK
jgi:hypothetical protein